MPEAEGHSMDPESLCMPLLHSVRKEDGRSQGWIGRMF